MVKRKSIYDPGSKDDGLRVLVTRYWPRGVKKDEKDYWFKELGPSPDLIRAWKEGEITWGEFALAYMDEYRSHQKRETLGELKEAIKESKRKNVTLLCTCRQNEHCHTEILKELVKNQRS